MLRYLCLILLIAALALHLFRSTLIRRGLKPLHATWFVSLVAICSFPLWFELHRGNVEFVVWTASSAGVFLFVHDRPRAASICFGIAAALKIYPVVFFALFLSRRFHRELFPGLATGAVLTLLGLAITQHRLQMACDRDRYYGCKRYLYVADWPVQVGFDHSLFALLKEAGRTRLLAAKLSKMLNLYTVGVGCIGAVIFLLRVRRLRVLNQILYLSTAMVLLPPVSYDYTLLHLYIPFALLTLAAVSGDERLRKALIPVFALLAFILSFQSEFILMGYRVAAQCKALALTALLVLAMSRAFIESDTASLRNAAEEV